MKMTLLRFVEQFYDKDKKEESSFWNLFNPFFAAFYWLKASN